MLLTTKATNYIILLIKSKELTYKPLYSFSTRELEILREYLQKELENSQIRYSISPIEALLLFVLKANRELRLYVNYYALNSIIVKDKCPLSLINKTLDRLTSAYYFTTLDLKDTYYYIWIKESNKQKIAFYIQYSYFEYLVIPFRLTNILASFQAYIN